MNDPTLRRALAAGALTLALMGGGCALAAEPPKDGGFAGRPLQQVAMTTTDLPRAIGFYRDVLGLPFLFESNGMAFFDLAGMRLMIAQDAERARGRPTTILYFDAPDFDAALAGLKARNVPLEGAVETVQRTAAGVLKLQQFTDPDGNALAILGLVPAS